MRFTPANWHEISPGTGYATEQGVVHVRSASKVALYIEAEGVEALAGCGRDIIARVEGECRYRVEALEESTHPVFTYQRVAEYIPRSSEVYTNADRLPMESGNLLEVSKALRAFKLEQRGMLQEMRRERENLERVRAAAAPEPTPEPKPEPKPELKPEPVTEEEEAPDAGTAAG